LVFVLELYDVRIEYCGVGSSNSKFNVCFKNKDTEIESNVIGSLDTSSPNKFHLTCVVDGTLYRSNIAFIENSVNLFNKVLFTIVKTCFKICKIYIYKIVVLTFCFMYIGWKQ